ncbi:MAG: fatty acid desaturase, partial [Rhodopirellula sp. JB055]
MSSSSPDAPADAFRFSEARALIGDLQRPNQAVYWVDFLCSILVGHVFLHGIFLLPWFYGFTPLVWTGMAVCYVLTLIL